MIDNTTLRAVADRIRREITEGCAVLRDGDILMAELHFSVAVETCKRLAALLDQPEPRPPLRKLCVVVTNRDPDHLPAWMNKRHGDPEDAA